MKNKILLFILCSFSFFAFNNIEDTINQYLLKNGEEINFSNKLSVEGQKSFTTMSKKAFDKSGFKLISDDGNIVISEISKARGPKQDEFLILDCTGKLIKNSDQVKFTFEKHKKEYYLVNLDSSKTVGTFDQISYMLIKSKTLNGLDAEFYCSQKDNSKTYVEKYSKDNVAQENQDTYRSISLVAVPKDIEKEELYKRFHKEKTIAYFSHIEIKDGNGKIHKYSRGNYILIEGQSLEIK